MISPNFIRAVKIEPFVFNYGVNTTIKYNEEESKEYLDIVNIDYYDAIVGTPFLRNMKWLSTS